MPRHSTAKRPEKQGLLYLIKMQGTNYFKIGVSSTEDMQSRLGSLQTGNPIALELVLVAEFDYPYIPEKDLHEYLAPYHVRGEWFKCDEHFIMNAFRLMVDDTLDVTLDQMQTICDGMDRNWPVGRIVKGMSGYTSTKYTDYCEKVHKVTAFLLELEEEESRITP